MKKLCPFSYFYKCIKKICKNFRKNRGGTDVQMGNSAEVVNGIIDSLNHIAGQHGRIIFSENFSFDRYLLTGDLAPALSWRYPDYIQNARTQAVHIVHSPYFTGALEDAYDSYAYRDGYVNTRTHAFSGGAVSDLGYMALYNQYYIYRGNQFDRVISDGINTDHNDFRLMGISVQEISTPVLDDSIHKCVIEKPVAGDGIKIGIIDDIRSTLHSIRTTHLPIVYNWSAIGFGSELSDDPDENGVKGFTIQHTTYKNLWDTDETERTANSIGVNFDAYMMGVGPSDVADGYKVKVKCDFYCRLVTDGGEVNGNIKIEGPDDCCADNTYEYDSITNTSWHWESGGYVYLDSRKFYDEATTARNKIDIFAKTIGGSAADYLQIAGILFYISYD